MKNKSMCGFFYVLSAVDYYRWEQRHKTIVPVDSGILHMKKLLSPYVNIRMV